MAGAGFDAAMIRDADGGSRTASAALAYFWSGLEEPARASASRRRSRSTARSWYDGEASCVLVGNVGKLFGGVEAFPDAGPTTACSSSASCTAEGQVQWARTLARAAVGDAPAVAVRPHDQRADGRRSSSTSKVRYELDGGDRSKVKKFKVRVEPAAIEVCVPVAAPAA